LREIFKAFDVPQGWGIDSPADPFRNSGFPAPLPIFGSQSEVTDCRLVERYRHIY
jgi:hypothetical protein